jgi:arylsulfatase A-like enzyme
LSWRTDRGLYTFDAKNANAPSRHQTEYFEMMGQWALYDDGWLLSTKVNRAPWEAFGAANPDTLNNQVFQLYDLHKDFSQADDIAGKYPAKVAEMREMLVAEAKKYQVFLWMRRWRLDLSRLPEHHCRAHGLARTPEKRKNSRRFGVHLEDLG